LVVGVIGGRVSVRLEETVRGGGTAARVELQGEPGNVVAPVNVAFPERDLEDLQLEGLQLFHELTPTLTMTRADRAGG
jgi:hypothetical protein